MSDHQFYMQRCFELALKGKGSVEPNPVVGAVIVHQNRIIGEGYHQEFGGPHAEVNAINSIQKKDLPLLKEATIYVSLEPCFHFGKTPPCVNLLLTHKIPKVVISVIDPTSKVNGQSIKKLRAEGVEVIVGVLESEGKKLIDSFLGQSA